MTYGPLLFLAAFFALSGSWFGFVLMPQVQVGRLGQTNTVPEGVAYPVARPGLARQGLEVYRANGCAYCHSQQIGQTGVSCDVLLTDAGTNQTALAAALLKVRPGLSEADARQMLAGLPKAVMQGVAKESADAAARALSVGGAKAQVWIQPVGPDISRGWGRRHSVAADFLYDYPVMLGEQRVGPDLATVGTRLPDPNWQLLHLYDPVSQVAKSTMPPYRYLFEERRIERVRSPDALNVPAPHGADHEIVPRPEARALVAYLMSLRADAVLFETPMSIPAAPAAPAPAATNAPTAGAVGNAAESFARNDQRGAK